MTPLLLSLRDRSRMVLLGAIAGMHLAIALLMNILFVENVLLLVLFVNYTPWLERMPGHAGGGTVTGSSG